MYSPTPKSIYSYILESEIIRKIVLFDKNKRLKMKTLGTVSDINHRGELLVKGSMAFQPGTVVFDARKNKVGNVIRTFGPVSSPYLLIKSAGIPDAEKMKLLSQELYFEKDGGDVRPSRNVRPRKGLNNKGAGKYGKEKRRHR